MRIALGLEYNGSRYCGWQQQKHSVSVQAAVEHALTKVADHPVRVICAGRTDTGVHASHQVIHFDTEAKRAMHAWVLGANSHLPDDISVLWSNMVDERFHARFNALSRSYRYIVLNRRSRPALLSKAVTWCRLPLQHAPMHVAAQDLLGEHDFSSYRAMHCQSKSPRRTIYRLDVHRKGDFIYFDICANAFLYHMVRNIVGVLLAIGRGEQPLKWAQAVLQARDRSTGGVTAPPYGLYLTDVGYPSDFSLPLAQDWPAFV